MVLDGKLLADWGEAHPSDLAIEIELRLGSGLEIVDLITANPQRHGIEFDQELLADAMSEALGQARYYNPDARGQIGAREAVAEYHTGIGRDQVILTPGTSFGYWYCFRLLAGVGGEVLCPSPTYPLFDDLARLAGADVRYFHLQPEGGRWRMDLEELEFQISSRTRVIALVSPHNPTGTVVSAEELAGLAEIARRKRLAIVFDEVFREFVHETADKEHSTRVARPSEFGAPFCITLNGVSKMFSLPGLKAGWMVVEGDEAEQKRFLTAVEYASDAFLPVSEYTQAMLPRLFSDGFIHTRNFQDVYSQRIQTLVDTFRNGGLDLRIPDAGIYLPVPVTENGPEDISFATQMLKEEGILVHPGSYYRLPGKHVILSCVNPSKSELDTLSSKLAGAD